MTKIKSSFLKMKNEINSLKKKIFSKSIISLGKMIQTLNKLDININW